MTYTTVDYVFFCLFGVAALLVVARGCAMIWFLYLVWRDRDEDRDTITSLAAGL